MSNASPVFKIALLGAESTGKTQLAHALATHLREAGAQAVAIDEYLREWCEQKGRTPQPNEQAEIALTQRLRIEQAMRDLAATGKPDQASYVIADTTPLMTAIYSEFIFQDGSLTPAALAYQHSFHLTLLTGLDMPWEADGIQRDGAHVRAPVDALIRTRLHCAGITYEVIYGTGDHRTQNALEAIARLSEKQDAINSIAPRTENTTANSSSDTKKWQWQCDKCSDADCEHRLFSKLRQAL
jgi:nicotinamide riboside kinase